MDEKTNTDCYNTSLIKYGSFYCTCSQEQWETNSTTKFNVIITLMFWNLFGSTLTFFGPLLTVVQVSSACGTPPEGLGLSRPPMLPEN